MKTQNSGRDFADGYALGNGVIGAMCWGGPASQIFSLNHFALWSNPPADLTPVEGLWPEVQELAAQEQWEEVQRKIVLGFNACTHGLGGRFQPVGDLVLQLETFSGAEKFERALDLANGMSSMTFTHGGTKVCSEAVILEDQPILRVKLTCEDPDGIGGAVLLQRQSNGDVSPPTTWATENDLGMSFQIPDGPAAEVRVTLNSTALPALRPLAAPDRPTPGQVLVAFAPTQELVIDVCLTVKSTLQLLERNPPSENSPSVLDHARVVLEGGGIDDIESPAHYAHLHRLGRYLFLSATDPTGLPVNLQGIWNRDPLALCSSDWHLDLNIQMAYWHVPGGNLLAYHEPFFRLMEQMLPGACESARKIYGIEGAVFPNASCGDGFSRRWFDARIGMGGWLLEHFHTHWQFTGDVEFARQRYLPILREVARFYLGYLQEDGGNLIISPASSPENRLEEFANTQFHRNTTFDISIFRSTFRNFLLISEVLGVKEDLNDKVARALSRLPEYTFDAQGTLLEYENIEMKRGHRHLCHLHPLFPGEEVGPEGDDSLRNGSRLALRKFESFPRTGMATWMNSSVHGGWAGWTYPYLALCWARLGEGDRALDCLRSYSRAFRCEGGLGLCFEMDNLGLGQGFLDYQKAEKWIEIDAALGVTASVQEMLLQSHGGVMSLLPALPSKWPQGRFTNLRARGGFELDVEWEIGKELRVKIRSLLGQPLRVKVPKQFSKATIDGRQILTHSGITVAIPTVAETEMELVCRS